MVDMVVLLHGNPQPLSRIQPELATFFNEHYLNGQEPTDANIAVRQQAHSSFFLSIYYQSTLLQTCNANCNLNACN